jgi:hypothetical protein
MSTARLLSQLPIESSVETGREGVTPKLRSHWPLLLLIEVFLALNF